MDGQGVCNASVRWTGPGRGLGGVSRPHGGGGGGGGDVWGPALRGGWQCVSQTDTVAGQACDVVVACDVAEGKYPLHIGTGTGCIKGHVERGWMHRKGPKHIGTHPNMSERIQTVVGDLGKALVAGGATASTEVGRGVLSVVKLS